MIGEAPGGFTAHNIRFPDGTVTMPGHPTLLADEAWWAGAKRVLSLVYGGDPRGRRIADLGCLEGGHALEFARMGMDALGIEVRRANF
jgi:SAM-dependent methyltransferase